MPFPTNPAAYLDPVSTTIAVALGQDPAALGVRGFPVSPTSKITDFYRVLPSDNMAQGGAARSVIGSPAPHITFTMSRDQFTCVRWSLRIPVPLRSVGDTSKDAENEALAVRTLTTNFLLSRSIQAASATMALSVWDQEWNGTIDFTSKTFDPISFWTNLRLEMFKKSGGSQTPNKLLIGPRALSGLKQNPILRGMLGTGERKIITNAMLLQLFEGLEEIVELMAVQLTSNAGASPSTIDFVCPDDALFCYAAPSASVAGPPSAVTIFEFSDPQQANLSVYRYDEPALSQSWRQIEAVYDFKITAPSLGAFVKQAVPAA